VGVTVADGCDWTASSDSSWLTITSGTPGSGQGAVGYSASVNASMAPRVGRLTIAGLTFTLTQAGVSCSYALSATSRTVASGATNGSLNVATTTGCPWSATSDAGWLTVSSGTGRAGPGTFTYDVAANSTGAVRIANIRVGVATFTLTQTGSCTFTLTPVTQSINASGGTGSVTVATGTDCSWAATRTGTWITITRGASGRGNGIVRYRVSSNPDAFPRNGTLTVAGQPVTITQGSIVAGVPTGLRVVTPR
jgi:hypothetical protein